LPYSLAHGRINPRISNRRSIDDIFDTYQLLVDRKVMGKVVIE
jgi:D-arabinose 1-dehydrogenase-like Zn-dependent alcohol dehydrogenase